VTNLWLEQYAGAHQSKIDLPSYISGYVDGEGCFTVSISPRPTIIVGWEVRPSLSVSQNGDRSEVLLEIQRYFGCGTLRPDRSDRTLKWEVRSLPLLVARYHPSLRDVSHPVRKAEGLRAIRRYLSANGSGTPPNRDGSVRDRTARWNDEPER
jgi:LAGLIDADG DNA endonuclease family protein